MGNPYRGDIKNPVPGQPLRAADIRDIYRGVGQGRTFAGAFSFGGTYAGGSCIVPFPSASPPSAETVDFPWTAFLTVVAGNFVANFFPGSVGGIIPASWTGIALTQSVVNYIYLQMTATAGLVTGVTIAASTTYPTLAANTSGNAPTAFNIPIAIADLTLSKPAITNIVGFGNIWCQPYVAHFDTINTGSLNTAPFTAWYNWEWGGS